MVEENTVQEREEVPARDTEATQEIDTVPEKEEETMAAEIEITEVVTETDQDLEEDTEIDQVPETEEDKQLDQYISKLYISQIAYSQ